MGGAHFNGSSHPTSTDPATWDFAGSMVSLEFPAGTGEEGVRKWLAEDPYGKGGVWDLEKVRIWKVKVAVSREIGLH